MTKKEKIRMLLKISPVFDNAEAGIRQILSVLEENKGERSDKAKKLVLEKSEEFTKKFVEMQVEAFDKLLSEDAIDAYLTFHTSKGGREVLSKLPEVTTMITERAKAMMETLLRMIRDIIHGPEDSLGLNTSGLFETEGGIGYVQPPMGFTPPEAKHDEDDELNDFKKRYNL